MKSMSNRTKQTAFYYGVIRDALQHKKFKIIRKSDLLNSQWTWLKTMFTIVDDQDKDFYKITIK